MQRAPDSIEQRTAATLWLERQFAQLYRLDYPPLYFMQAFRRPVQFKAVWQLPVAGDPQRLLYVAEAPQGLVGYFFADEIQPSSDIWQADAPWPADIRDWRTEDELERYLQAVGYCVRVYPERLHIEAYCRLAHESEQAMPREAADRPQVRAVGGLGGPAQPVLPQAPEPATRIRGWCEQTRVRHTRRTPRGVQTTEER